MNKELVELLEKIKAMVDEVLAKAKSGTKDDPPDEPPPNKP